MAVCMYVASQHSCFKKMQFFLWLTQRRYLSLTACSAVSGGFGRNESGRWNCRPRSDLSPSTRTHDWGSEDQDGEIRDVEEK